MNIFQRFFYWLSGAAAMNQAPTRTLAPVIVSGATPGANVSPPEASAAPVGVASPPPGHIFTIVQLPTGKKILDASRYQGLINFKLINKNDFVGIMLKATEGDTLVDSFLLPNYRAAVAAGFEVGFYHFLHIKSDPLAQARNFLSAIKGLTISSLFGCAVDLEWDDGLQVAGEEGAKCALTFLSQVPDPLVYTAPGFFEGITLVTRQKFAAYRLWLAQYGVSKPKIPAPWTKYWAWQYISKAMVSGVNGPCDVSVIG